MDIYLPEDFRQLHASAPDDWRDASSTTTARDRGDLPRYPSDDIGDRQNRCADPLWRVF